MSNLTTSEMLDYLYNTIGHTAVKEAMSIRRGIKDGIYWTSSGVVAQLYEEVHGMSERKAILYQTAIVKMDVATVSEFKKHAGKYVKVDWVESFNNAAGRLCHKFLCSTEDGCEFVTEDKHLERFCL